MFDFFKMPRDRSAGADAPADGSRLAPGMSKTPEPALSNRELVRIVLRDTLRRNGIPPDWIGSQIASRTQPGQPTAHQIQLVILKWHEGLLRFAPLLEQQILQGLRQFDPQSDHSGHIVVWSFAPNCGCPYTTLPAPSYWSAAEKPKFDLPPSPRKFQEVDDDFATTVPSPLS